MPDGATILIVEDDRDIAESLADLLRDEGYQVEIAVDGMDGVARAQALRPSAIILDVMLPHLDGVGVAAELKRIGGGLERVPLLVVSAGRQLDQATKQIQTPFSLRKPFTLEQILALLERALSPAA